MITTLGDRFSILKVLDQDEFGHVFLAEDQQSPAPRLCVIRELHPLGTHPQAKQEARVAFERVATTLKEWTSQGAPVPRVYATIEAGEKFYLVQEWIEGSTLEEIVQQQGPLPESQVRQILAQVLSGLVVVHGKRVLHGDLRPETIIVRSVDGVPILTNFAFTKAAMADSTLTTKQRAALVNPSEFVPAEQLAGHPTFASDGYSAGLLAIYLLTGQRPVGLEKDAITGQPHWMAHTALSAEFADFLVKATQPHPGDRFFTARSMLVGLNNLPPLASVPATVLSPLPVSQALVSSLEAVQDRKRPTGNSPKARSPKAGFPKTESGLLPFLRRAIANSAIWLVMIGLVTLMAPLIVQARLNHEIQAQETQLTRFQGTQIQEQATTQQELQQEMAAVQQRQVMGAWREQSRQGTPISYDWESKGFWGDQMPEGSVALTFDDGPDPNYTDEVLDLLKQYQIRATFFVVGWRVREHCDLVKRILDEGHELGNHTYDHPHLTTLSPQGQFSQINDTQTALMDCGIANYELPLWFRAPYGAQNQTTLDAAFTVGLSSALWSIDTNDWQAASTSDSIARSILATQGRDVVLMHDATTRPYTVQALKTVLPELQKRNYQFLTMSEAIPRQP